MQTRNRPGAAIPGAASKQVEQTKTSVPLAWHEQTEHEVAVSYAQGYAAGYAAALRDIAEGYAELHQSWRIHADPELTYEQRVARRLAEMTPPDWLDQLDRRAAANRAHDRRCIERAMAATKRDALGRRAA